jgi:uncharacterized protein YjbI with pentapeptide repeats
MGKEEDPIPFAGKQWCRFHLPLEVDGEPSEKADWDPQEIQSFNKVVFEILEAPRDEGESADLSGVIFPGSISFSTDAHGNSSTLPPVLFFNAVFHSWALFREATFGGHALFNGAAFKGSADFISATFKNSAQFEGTTFKDYAFFKGAKFENQAFFKGAKFEGPAWFAGAKFEGNTYFDGGMVRGDADFSCEASPKEENADAFRQISFAGREFHGEVKFTNRRFLDKTSFKGTVFHVAPEFHNCALHQDTDFSDPNFRDTKSDHAARAYRTLKLAMERVRARQEEAGFYALEQKSLCEQENTPWWVKRLSELYETTSEFGRSASRPFLWFVWLQAIAFWGYYNLTDRFQDKPAEALRFTFAQVARPFMALSPGSGGGNNELSAGIALLAGLHSFLSLALIALLLLALRWRFRRG